MLPAMASSKAINFETLLGENSCQQSGEPRHESEEQVKSNSEVAPDFQQVLVVIFTPRPHYKVDEQACLARCKGGGRICKSRLMCSM